MDEVMLHLSKHHRADLTVVLSWIGSCLTLTANSVAVTASHHHVACCCPFPGVALLIITWAAAHQKPLQHAHHPLTHCLQHPTGIASQMAHMEERELVIHFCIVTFCFAACISPPSS